MTRRHHRPHQESGSSEDSGGGAALFYPSTCKHERIRVADLYRKPEGAAQLDASAAAAAARLPASAAGCREGSRRERQALAAFRAVCRQAGVAGGTSIRVFMKGTYGCTYVLRGAAECARLSQFLVTRGMDVVGAPAPAAGGSAPTKAIVKVQLLTDADQCVESFHEDSIHHYIQSHCSMVGQHRVHGSEVVPAFYTGAAVTVGTTMSAAGRLRHGTAVIRVRIMELVEGLALCETVQRATSCADADPASLARGCALLYARIERALVFLWGLGISHGDLHDSNILVSPHGVPRLIDLGFAVTLEPRASSLLARRLAPLPRMFARGRAAYPHRVYLCVAQRNVSHVLHQRGYRTYNHDAAVLVCLLKRLSLLCTEAGASVAATLGAARRRLW